MLFREDPISILTLHVSVFAADEMNGKNMRIDIITIIFSRSVIDGQLFYIKCCLGTPGVSLRAVQEKYFVLFPHEEKLNTFVWLDNIRYIMSTL